MQQGAYPPHQPNPQPGQQVVVVPVEQAKFDAGARFDHNSPPSIPPPPPGVMPNSAQMPGMGPQVVKQSKGGIIKGTGWGGATFW